MTKRTTEVESQYDPERLNITIERDAQLGPGISVKIKDNLLQKEKYEKLLGLIDEDPFREIRAKYCLDDKEVTRIHESFLAMCARTNVDPTSIRYNPETTEFEITGIQYVPGTKIRVEASK